MLDSFNHIEQQPENKNDFNPREHLNSLCENGRIKIEPHGKILYKKGWTGIIEELILSICKHQIEISTFYEEFGQLNVGFYSYEKNQEVRVWRAVSRAQLKSKETCTECGEAARRVVRGEKIAVICRSCIHKAESNGDTGTWLDKY